MSATDIKAGSAYVELYGRGAPFVKALDEWEGKLRSWGQRVSTMGRTMFTAGMVGIMAVALPTKIYAGFSDQMQVVRAVTQATGAEFAALTDQAKELGRTTSFTASQVAEGMTGLGRMGFAPEEIQASIGAMLNLARATDTELGPAAEIAAATLRAFRKEAEEAGYVADVLTVTANNSAQTLTDLGEAMKYAAPIADAAGESLESTAKALGVLANLGIKGTMAGTALRTMWLQLAKSDVQEKLRAMGVEALDSAGNLRPLADVLANVAGKINSMGTGKKMELADALFGQRAVGAALKLSGSPEDLAKLAIAIAKAAGAAEETAGIMDSELGGAIRRLLSGVEGIAIAIGSGLAPTLQVWADYLTDLAGRVTVFVERHQTLLTVAAKAIGTLTAVGGTMWALGASVKAAAASLAAFTAIQGALIRHPIVATIGLAAAATAYLTSTTADLADEQQKLLQKTDAQRQSDERLIARLGQLAERQQLSTEEAAEANMIISDLESRYGDLGASVNEATQSVEGFATAQERANAKMAEAAEAQIDAAIAEREANIKEIQRQLERSTGWFSRGSRGIMSWFGGESPDQAVDRLGEQAKSELAARDALIERLRAMRTGKPGAVTGTGTAPAAGDLDTQLAEDAANTKEDKAKAVARIEEELANRLHEARIQQIADEEERELASIDRRYQKIWNEALEAGATDEISQRFDVAQEADRAAVRARFAKEREDEQKKEAERRGDYEKSIDEQTAEAAIRANKDLTDREREEQILELERRKALDQAAELGMDPEKINRLYDLKRDALAGPENTTGSIGTTSARAAQYLARGATTVQDAIRRATERTAAAVEQLAEAEEERENTWGA